MGNMGAAMSIINAKSNLPAICGRVCPHEKQCQGHCVLGKKGKPVQIGKLEQFIADFDTKMNLSREKLPQKTRGRVAVIGSDLLVLPWLVISPARVSMLPSSRDRLSRAAC